MMSYDETSRQQQEIAVNLFNLSVRKWYKVQIHVYNVWKQFSALMAGVVSNDSK